MALRTSALATLLCLGLAAPAGAQPSGTMSTQAYTAEVCASFADACAETAAKLMAERRPVHVTLYAMCAAAYHAAGGEAAKRKANECFFTALSGVHELSVTALAANQPTRLQGGPWEVFSADAFAEALTARLSAAAGDCAQRPTVHTQFNCYVSAFRKADGPPKP